MRAFPVLIAKYRPTLLLITGLVISGGTAVLPVPVKFGVANFLVRIVYAPFFRISNKIDELKSLYVANRDLNRVLAELSLENARLRTAAEENARLRELLGFAEPLPYHLIPAEVITLDPQYPFRSALIAAGTERGVRRFLPVIDRFGVAGKISAVTARQAEVQLLFDPGFRAAARDLRSGVLGIVRWKKEFLLAFDNVPNREDVQIGDSVITSGLGGVFPEGLPLGRVIRVQTDSMAFFKSILVEPLARLATVDELFVLALPPATRSGALEGEPEP